MATETLMKTTTTSIASMFPVEYYDRKLLKVLKDLLVYANFGQKRSIPENGGLVIQMRKYTKFDANTTALTEGVLPDSLTMTQTDINATVAEYGDYIAISSKATMSALDPIVNDAVELLGDRAAKSIDALIRNELKNATNIIFTAASGTRATAVTDLTDAHVLTTDEIRMAVRALKAKGATPFYRNGRPYYYAVVDPYTAYDLQADTKWVNVGTYQQGERIETGEIGKLFGVVFIETNQSIMWAGAGATKSGSDKYNVYGTPVFGPDAYGLIDITGNGGIKVYMEEGGGVGDPLHQKKTVGYKIPAFVAKLLDNDRIVMIKHGVTGGTA